ncbi:MAG: TlpA disulfide reductase family protein [Betaproteobacteria bacterium]
MNCEFLCRVLSATMMCLAAASSCALAATLEPSTGARAPVLALRDLQGQARSLDEFHGKVVIVNFWATWCEPCMEEMPSLQRLADRLADRNLVVLGVNLGEGEARIKAFTEKAGTTFPILLDRDGVARKSWKVNGMPATFVLDGNGRIRLSHVGALDFSDAGIANQIEGLLRRPKEK